MIGGRTELWEKAPGVSGGAETSFLSLPEVDWTTESLRIFYHRIMVCLWTRSEA